MTLGQYVAQQLENNEQIDPNELQRLMRAQAKADGHHDVVINVKGADPDPEEDIMKLKVFHGHAPATEEQLAAAEIHYAYTDGEKWAVLPEETALLHEHKVKIRWKGESQIRTLKKVSKLWCKGHLKFAKNPIKKDWKPEVNGIVRTVDKFMRIIKIETV